MRDCERAFTSDHDGLFAAGRADHGHARGRHRRQPGSNDLRVLHAAGTPEARFALEHFTYWATRHAGSLVAAMGGLDAVVFTGGIGENDPTVRAGILQGLGFLGVRAALDANARNASVLHDPTSRVAIWIVPAEEERQIALEAQAVMSGVAQGPMAGGKP